MTAQLPSRERLEALASGNAFTCVQDDEAAAMARALLTAHEQEPIYQVWDDGNWADYDKAAFEAAQGMSARSRIVYTHPAPVPAVPECFERLLAHAQGIAMGVDWNKGTAATHHRDKLCQAVKSCAAML
ncbi:MAG: hypothetical protein E6325_27205, partial [Enterobacteriaceae bacterium]|nr:hypothetical protein [Enterobacteriaceae bacterium]